MSKTIVANRRNMPSAKVIDNGNGTFSIPGTFIVEVDTAAVMAAIMALRGFPNGMHPDKYPNQAACEKASPGVVAAQSKCRGTYVQACWVTIDIDGNRTVELEPTPRKKKTGK